MDLGVGTGSGASRCGGLDEISLAGETQIAEVSNGTARRLRRWFPRTSASTARRVDVLRGGDGE